MSPAFSIIFYAWSNFKSDISARTQRHLQIWDGRRREKLKKERSRERKKERKKESKKGRKKEKREKRKKSKFTKKEGRSKPNFKEEGLEKKDILMENKTCFKQL